ncbi:MAG: hypothetical protein J7L12_01260 [Desulfurococcales archaeon]|nr:hypothetical protein [Desulfurococcales archaeon]
MTTLIKEFNSISEFIKDLDTTLAEYRRRLGELLRRLEDLRVKAEHERRLKELLSKLGGSAGGATSNVIKLKTINLVMNPSPQQEIATLEEAVENLNNKITLLQTMRKDLESIANTEIEVKVSVIYIDGLPKTLFIRIT